MAVVAVPLSQELCSHLSPQLISIILNIIVPIILLNHFGTGAHLFRQCFHGGTKPVLLRQRSCCVGMAKAGQ